MSYKQLYLESKAHYYELKGGSYSDLAKQSMIKKTIKNQPKIASKTNRDRTTNVKESDIIFTNYVVDDDYEYEYDYEDDIEVIKLETKTTRETPPNIPKNNGNRDRAVAFFEK